MNFVVGFKGWILAILVALASTGFASITPAKKPYYTSSRDDLLQVASNLDLPSGTTKADEPFIYLQIGPVRSDFFALSFAKTSPEEFAKLADEGLRAAFGQELNVKYSSERNLSVLDSDIETSQWFKSSSTQVVDIAKLRSVFEAKGLHPKILLRTFQRTNQTGFTSEIHRRKAYAYSDGTHLDKVSSSESYSPFAYLLLIVFVAFLPTFMKVAIARALRKSSDESIPIEERREKYKNRVYGSMAVGIAVHLACFIWFYGSNQFSIMSDLWTGSSVLTSFASMFLMAGILFLGKVVKKFEGEEDALMGVDRTAKIAEQQYMNRIRRPYMVLTGIVLLFAVSGFWYVATVLRQFGPAVSVLLIPLIVLIACMTPFENYRMRKYPREQASDSIVT